MRAQHSVKGNKPIRLVSRKGNRRFNIFQVGVQADQVAKIMSSNEKELDAAVRSVGPVSIAFQVVSDCYCYQSGVNKSAKCRLGEKDVSCW